MNTDHLRYSSFFTKFTILWLVFGLIVLIGTFYYQWQQLHIQHQNKLTDEAGEITKNLDNFIYRNLDEFGNLSSSFGFNFCQDLTPKLIEKLYNNPSVSAVIISNNNRIVCSTIKQAINLPQPVHYSLSLTGPYTLGTGMSNAFLIQQQMGAYSLGLLVLDKVINNFIEQQNHSFYRIALYDNDSRHMLTEVGIQNKIQNSIVFKKNLTNANNILLVFTAKPVKISNFFVLKALIINLSLLLLLLLLYFYFSHLINHRLSLSYALNNAIRSQHFHPVYQPIWHAQQGKFSGAEVLIRWKTAAQEIIMPDFFIEEAERSGLIIPITWQLIERALSETSELLNEYPDFHLAFNLSARHFNHPYFFSEFYGFCKTNKIRPQQLILELTEREFLDKDNPQIIRQMQELKNLGFSIAIDDFGTGHASINYLQHFPFDYLKIDKLFIQAIGTGAITETLNHAIINLANTLELTIIAEGVETKEQYDFLVSKEVNWMQGWYFAKAMTLDELLSLIRYKAKP
ncbi:Rtn protein [Legionella birminghamensis]|uniref:Rtn protein n=1 Tax=Legionella birminghamensis TaxID=28083 RepID=A0A378IAG9_9GAMM|nr:EAL domain-containing protein [Legionella birminghamensis]KTC69299.1 Rtn protein [Legionella birminghamensis]STX31561.1 Rtn protein [Legionella birminghamensis]